MNKNIIIIILLVGLILGGIYWYSQNSAPQKNNSNGEASNLVPPALPE